MEVAVITCPMVHGLALLLTLKPQPPCPASVFIRKDFPWRAAPKIAIKLRGFEVERDAR